MAGALILRNADINSWEPFAPLADDPLFRSVQTDPHGYGVVWSDDIDLAELELWLHGETAEPDAAVDR